MARFRIARIAGRDIDGIWDYIAEDNPRAAETFTRNLKKKFVQLAEFPAMGTTCDELGVGLRRLPFKNYVILYRPMADGVEIARILHGARDIDRIPGPSEES